MQNYSKLLHLAIGILIGLLIGLNLSLQATAPADPILLPEDSADDVALRTPAMLTMGNPTKDEPRVPVVLESELRDKTESKVAIEILDVLGPNWVTEENPKSEGKGPTFGGLRHGEWAIFWPNRNWTEVGGYVLGARHGTWLIHDENGVLLRETTYVGGKKNGPCRDRSSATDPWRSYRYIDDKLVE